MTTFLTWIFATIIRFAMLLLAAGLILSSLQSMIASGLNFWDIFWILFGLYFVIAATRKVTV